MQPHDPITLLSQGTMRLQKYHADCKEQRCPTEAASHGVQPVVPKGAYSDNEGVRVSMLLY